MSTRLKEKLRRRVGMTLSEMLLAVLILSLASGVIASTMALATEHFATQTRTSEAEMLCNTLSLSVRQQLSHVVSYDSTTKTFRSTAGGMERVPCQFMVGKYAGAASFEAASTGQIVLAYQGDGDAVAYYPLINSADYADYGKALTAALDVAVKDGHFEVTVTVGDGGKVSATESFTVYPSLTTADIR